MGHTTVFAINRNQFMKSILKCFFFLSKFFAKWYSVWMHCSFNAMDILFEMNNKFIISSKWIQVGFIQKLYSHYDQKNIVLYKNTVFSSCNMSRQAYNVTSSISMIFFSFSLSFNVHKRQNVRNENKWIYFWIWWSPIINVLYSVLKSFSSKWRLHCGYLPINKKKIE